jgi:hypothetical protein
MSELSPRRDIIEQPKSSIWDFVFGIVSVRGAAFDIRISDFASLKEDCDGNKNKPL